MTNYIGLCNEVLLQVGERETSSLTSSPVSKKVALAVRGGVDAVSRMHAWRHLRVSVSSTTWVNNIVTLPPFQQIYEVYSGTNILSESNAVAIQNKNVTAPQTGIPQWFACIGQDRVMVYPTPTDVTMRNAMVFRLLLEPTIPQVGTDDLAQPNGFLELVSLHAQVTMHRTHTGDMNALRATAADFENRLIATKTRDNLNTSHTLG